METFPKEAILTSSRQQVSIHSHTVTHTPVRNPPLPPPPPLSCPSGGRRPSLSQDTPDSSRSDALQPGQRLLSEEGDGQGEEGAAAGSLPVHWQAPSTGHPAVGLHRASQR